MTKKLRKCLVYGEKAYFHKWIEVAKSEQEQKGIKIKCTEGLIEMENGKIISVEPTAIQFFDWNADWCFFNSPR